MQRNNMFDRHGIELVAFALIFITHLVVKFMQVLAKHRGDNVRVGQTEVIARVMLLLLFALLAAHSMDFVLRLLTVGCVIYMTVLVVLAYQRIPPRTPEVPEEVNARRTIS